MPSVSVQWEIVLDVCRPCARATSFEAGSGPSQIAQSLIAIEPKPLESVEFTETE
jgi:hypothetical protein